MAEMAAAPLLATAGMDDDAATAGVVDDAVAAVVVADDSAFVAATLAAPSSTGSSTFLALASPPSIESCRSLRLALAP
jgi:hypothetical protein